MPRKTHDLLTFSGSHPTAAQADQSIMYLLYRRPPPFVLDICDLMVAALSEPEMPPREIPGYTLLPLTPYRNPMGFRYLFIFIVCSCIMNMLRK